VGATHRKLSKYLNALLDAGLEVEHFAEPLRHGAATLALAAAPTCAPCKSS
jgi:hypothetical protein